MRASVYRGGLTALSWQTSEPTVPGPSYRSFSHLEGERERERGR